MNILVLTSSQIAQIESEGARAYPNECCGIIIGRDVPNGANTRRVVERLEPMKNVWDPAEQRRRFEIDGLAVIAADKAARADGFDIVGFYHSHPDHPARPSETDRTMASEYYSYVIVSIAQGKAVDMTSWLLDYESKTFSRQDMEELKVDPKV